ncbi:zinc finger protein 11 isoform X1 [Procambarus clarkii]|uniref:zinc finger protein 11 isoform X1 n=1 Tax=Procambarus clarkii TaxID=6728 RepID=UPI001E66FF48|nr:zinc finger protein 845-like isoform X1 [Procambarus clarkii]
MASDKKIIDEVGESSHDTPQAITITIMDPSALEATDLDSSLVTSVETQDDRHGTSTLLVVPGDGHASISVEHGAKNILQTVTETHMGTHELPVISNISNPEEETSEQNSIHVTKTSQIIDEGEGVDEEDGEEPDESVGQHCLICNVDLPSEESTEPVLVFKTQTTTTQRKMSVFLGSLIGQKLTSRKAHSDIMCHRCFGLLDRVDSLEVEIRDTKEEIVNKYQETVAVYGGRARRRKPATAKKTDYVFPKVEPEDEDEQVLGLEMDENFEPRVEDLMEEENDHREDRSTQDEEWEPEFKKPRIKREAVDAESSGPTKRKRGRPRKDAAKPKGNEEMALAESKDELHEEIPEDDIAQLLETTPELKHFFVTSQNPFCRMILTCKSCGHIFTSAQSLASHHCNYECEKCGLEENNLATITQHLSVCPFLNAHQSRTNSLSCNFCSSVFKEKLELQQHKEEHVNDCLKQYANLLKEQGLAETPCTDPQPPLKRGRPRKMSDCIKCSLMYGSPADLDRHIKLIHPKTLTHACRLCDDRFLHQQQLELHIVEHFLGSYACDFCGVHFGYKYPFLKHLEANHTGDFLLKCEFCDFTTGTFNDYRSHRREPHIGGKDVDSASICHQCEELIPQDEMEEHIDEHLLAREPVPVMTNVSSDQHLRKVKRRRGRPGRRKSHKCFDCNLTFPSPAGLSRHNHEHHPQKYTRQCEICGHGFKGKRALELHRDGHENGSCWCPICKLKFKHRQHVEHHFTRAHADVTNMDCEYCSIQVTSYSKYMYHCRTVHADLLEDRAELKCHLCGKNVSSRILLNKHMAKQHGQNRQNAPKNECPVCKKYFVHVDVHMNLHTRAVQFPCEECGEVFFLRSSLLAHHKLRHDQNARAHICKICNKGFVSSSLLRTHHEQVHLQKRQYFCEFCGRSYKNKSALTYHLKVHTGERPFKCQECGLSFHRPSALKTHMEGTHHLPYSYLYRKPQRRAGAGIMEVTNSLENTEQNKKDPSSITAINVPKSIIIGNEVRIDDINIDGEMGMVEGVDEVVGVSNVADVSVNMNGSEIITVVEDLRNLPDLYREGGEEDVYIIQAIEHA